MALDVFFCLIAGDALICPTYLNVDSYSYVLSI